MKTLSCVCAAIVVAASSPAIVQASVMNGSGEFRVNTQTAGSQQVPRIVATPDGFVVVWSGAYLDGDGYGSAGRSFDGRGIPAGDDFQVNEWTTGYQAMPSVAAGAEGDFLVAWHYEGEGDAFGVFGRVFDPEAPSASVEFEVNAWTTSAQFSPAVAGSTSGGFVVVWSSLGQDGSGTGVFGRLVDSTGATVGGEFQVNTWTTGFQSSPRVAMDEAGNFEVVWQSLLQDGYGYGVYARHFDSTGTPTGPETRISSFALADDMLPAISMNRDGEFIVAWQRSESSGLGTDIYAKRFDSDGVASDPEFQVNTYTTGFQQAPSVGIGPFGAFMVAWQDASQDGDGEGVFGRIYDAGGLPVDGEMQLNGWTTGSQGRAEVTAAGPGEFVVVWQSEGQDGDGYGVFGRRLLISGFCLDGDADADGVCETYDNCPDLYNPDQDDANFDGLGDDCDMRVTFPVDGAVVSCANPALARPTITWHPAEYDAFKVFLSPDPHFTKGNRIASADKFRRWTSWLPSKKKWKKACKKAVETNASNPILYVRVLGKDRDLPKSDPNRKSYSPSVRVGLLY